MAKARMLHKKISLSSQVNKLSLSARLLFTWMISHADDDGRLKGDAEYVKATVVPMTKWSGKSIKKWLHEIGNARLIYYWEIDGEWFIEFIKWKQHQQIKSDRYKASDLPSNIREKGGHISPEGSQGGSILDTQSNLSESSKVESNQELNISELNKNSDIADKNFFKRIGQIIISPKDFNPSNEGETAALDAWKQLEPYNPLSFQTTYLQAYHRGLPASLFFQFMSEIKQDPTIRNPGAIFNKKVAEYFERER